MLRLGRAHLESPLKYRVPTNSDTSWAAGATVQVWHVRIYCLIYYLSFFLRWNYIEVSERSYTVLNLGRFHNQCHSLRLCHGFLQPAPHVAFVSVLKTWRRHCLPMIGLSKCFQCPSRS